MKTVNTKIHFYFKPNVDAVCSVNPNYLQASIIHNFTRLLDNINFKNISWYIDDHSYFNCYRISGYKQFTHVLIITRHYD